MALAATRLGLKTAWAGEFGADMFSRLALGIASDEGMDPIAFRHFEGSGRMVSAAFADERERGFITYREREITPPELSVLDSVRPRWLLQSFRYTPEWLRFITAAKSSGCRVFGDCSGDGATLDTPGVRDFIGLCDVFSPNEAEAMTLTEANTAEEALERLSELTPSVIVKRGAAGAKAIVDGKRFERSAPAIAVVDTVAAGDAFAAGFVAGQVWGLPFERSLELAVGCGSMSTRGAGSLAVPTRADLEAFTAGEHVCAA